MDPSWLCTPAAHLLATPALFLPQRFPHSAKEKTSWFVFVNTSCTGPFLPTCWVKCWMTSLHVLLSALLTVQLFYAQQRQASLYSLMLLMNLLQSYWKRKHGTRHWGFIEWKFGDLLLYRLPLLVHINNFLSHKFKFSRFFKLVVGAELCFTPADTHRRFCFRLLFHTVSNGCYEILANTWAKTII